MDVIEIKAFVPAKDFDLSLQFYRDPGFKAGILSADMVYLYVGRCSFLLQRFHVKEHTENFMMHILVRDVAS